METKIRYVTAGDKDFWYSLDRHLPETEFYEKVRTKRGYVLELDGMPVGLLRYGLFWDNTPFCTMLFVNVRHQGQGYGKALMAHWEQEMKAQGYKMLMTSTRADEISQHFYRAIGYKDCGGIVIDIAPYAQPMELFLVKEMK